MRGLYKSEDGARQVRERYLELLNQWPVPCQQLRVPTRQGETFVLACGPETAPPLLLFHGSHGNAVMWIFDVRAWSKHFRIYAVDMIGEAGLSAPSRPPLKSDAYALWLDDVMRALSLERVSIVGISLGGWLALDYATRRPERVERLALLCPGGVGRQRTTFMLKVLPLLLLGRWGRRKASELVVGRAPGNLHPVVQRFVDFVSLIHEQFKGRVVKLPIFTDAALQRLTMPVMAVVGAKDPLLSSAETKNRLERNVAHVEVHYLPEAAHVLPGQTAAILDFLSKRKAA